MGRDSQVVTKPAPGPPVVSRAKTPSSSRNPRRERRVLSVLGNRMPNPSSVLVPVPKVQRPAQASPHLRHRRMRPLLSEAIQVVHQPSSSPRK